MIRPLRAALLLLLAAAACQSSPDEDTGPRHTNDADQVSFVVPQGFTLTRDRETWLLRKGAQVIAVRSVPRDGWSEDRSLEMLAPATAKSLHGLPGARVTGPVPAKHPSLDGAAFDVVFEPASRPGERHRRRHVILVGDQRVFHVLMTGPAQQHSDATASFDRLLDSVREEG